MTEKKDGEYSAIVDMDDEALADTKALASKLLSSDGEVSRISATMLTSRRVYSLARIRLTELMTEQGHRWEDGVEEIFIESTSSAANDPFMRDRVVAAVKSDLVPFVLEDLEREVASEVHQGVIQRQREAELRVKRPVPIVLTKADMDIMLERDETLILVGTVDSVALEMNSCVAQLRRINATESELPKLAALGLTSAADVGGQQMLSNRKVELYIRRTVELWQGMATRRASMEKKLGVWCQHLLGKRCDVVFVEDGVILGSSCGPLLVALNQGVRQLRRWCDESKAALVVGAPYRDGATEEERAEWLLGVTELFGKYYKVVDLDSIE